MRIVTLILALAATLVGQSAKAQCDGVLATLVLETGLWANEIDFTITNDQDVVILSLDNLTNQTQNNSVYTADVCLPYGCYTLNQFDSFGDGWNGGSITLSYDSTMVTLPGLPDGEYGSIGFGIYTDGCEEGNTGNQIPGCTDPSAINYQPWATVDNGSCQYSQECEEGVLVSLYICTFSNGNEVQLELYNENNELLFLADSLGNAAIEYFELCLPADQCINALMSNITGPNGWYNGYFWVNYNGMQVVTGSLPQGQEYGEVSFSLNGTACPYGGCTDPEALNFDPGASFEDGSCEYPVDCGGLNAVTATLWSASPTNQIFWFLTDENSQQVATGMNNFGSAIAMDTLCLADGCYTLYLQNVGGPNAPGGALILESTGFSVSYQLLPGDNIGGGFGANSMAYVVSINSECDELAFGCTDPSATNYDANAEFNDGSCTYPAPDNDLCANATALQPGMQLISNVNAFENENIWGECWAFGSGEGEQTSVWFTFTTPEDPASIHIEAIADGTNSLMDTQFGLFTECGGEMIYCDGNSGQGLLSAFTFGCGELEPNTTYILMVDGYFGDMGTCYLDYAVTECGPVDGCTDPLALNYNPAATNDDGSCIYPEPCEANEIIMVINTQAWGEEISWALIAADGSIAAEGSGYDSYSSSTEGFCVADGCYTIELYDSFGDGWNGGNFMLQNANGGNYASGSLTSGSFSSIPVAINSECEGTEIMGCTDPIATNYNPNATIDDGSCLYNEDCEDNLFVAFFQGELWVNEISWDIVNTSGQTVLVGNGYSNQNDSTQSMLVACLPNGCYTVNMYDSFGDGWNGATLTLIFNGNEIVVGMPTGSADSFSFGINATGCADGNDATGCTDPEALNYNPTATEDDGSCLYSQNGPQVEGFFDPMEVDLYPNPSEGNVNLDIFNGNGDEAMSIQIFDLQGRVVYTREFGFDQERLRVTFDANQFPAGVYLVQVLNGQERHIERMVRQ